MGDRKYGLITEEDIQNIHVMSEYNFDNATESRSAAAGAAGVMRPQNSRFSLAR